MVPLEWKFFDIGSAMLHWYVVPVVALFRQYSLSRYVLTEKLLWISKVEGSQNLYYFGGIKDSLLHFFRISF